MTDKNSREDKGSNIGSIIDQPATLNTSSTKTTANCHPLAPAQKNTTKKNLKVEILSLNQLYVLELPHGATIECLIDTLWGRIDVSTEQCRRETHILLLFTHRTHIFLGSENELVSDFVELAPSNPHFYFYKLKRNQQKDEMYTYDTKLSNIFSERTGWWTSACFGVDAQQPRSQSILLGSLYALRLFFRR